MIQMNIMLHDGSRRLPKDFTALFPFLESAGDGRIARANSKRRQTQGCRPSEINDQQHFVFADARYNSIQNDKTSRVTAGPGDSDAQDCRRMAKSGHEIWISARDSPIKGAGERGLNIVRLATDLTMSELGNAKTAAKPDAMSRARAVTGFTPGSEILDTNQIVRPAPGHGADAPKGNPYRSGSRRGAVRCQI